MDKALTELLAEIGHEVDLSNHDEDSPEEKSDEKKEDAEPTP